MTSTSFNVGLNSVTRNSSKVLKPPGGGSSDIFGMSSEPAEPQRKTKNQHLTSSIFGGETVTESRNKAVDKPVAVEKAAPAAVNGAAASSVAAAPVASVPAPSAAASAPAAKRVPPGGFSSGLW